MLHTVPQKYPHVDGLQTPFGRIVGRCPQMRRLFRTIKLLAQKPKATVLICGESGTGKELVARAIHYTSPMYAQPFIEINCAAVPESLLESELFGYEKGAFTDARQNKKGLLELADGGTFFLDEIGDLSLRLQIKLAKAIEEKTFRRVGGTKNISVSMRIMAATNKNLHLEIERGNFRYDLFYRLNVISINLPPLRQRGEDILLLAYHFLNTFNREHNCRVQGLSPQAERLLLEYPWPGNVRELKNAIERAMILGDSELIKPEHLALGSGHTVTNFPVKIEVERNIQVNIPAQGISLDHIEKRIIEKALKIAKGNVSQAARLLRISRETIRYRMQKFGVEKW
ncbi:MAG: sigma-54 interaction domain-containing protein [bacterium]